MSCRLATNTGVNFYGRELMTNTRIVSVCGVARTEDENIRPPGKRTLGAQEGFSYCQPMNHGTMYCTVYRVLRDANLGAQDLSPPFRGAVSPLVSARAGLLVCHVVAVTVLYSTYSTVPHRIVDLLGEGDNSRTLVVYPAGDRMADYWYVVLSHEQR
jgi:hypothetical protein